MHFIMGHPKENGKNYIFGIVDRLTKYVHHFAITTGFKAHVVDLFFKEVFQLHGLSKTIVSDRGKKFLNPFWQELFRLTNIEHTHSPSYHPQTNGWMESILMDQMLHI